MKFSFLALFIFTFNCIGDELDEGKEQSQFLYDSAVGFAEQILLSDGEFIPYDEALNSNHEIVSVAADIGEEYPSSKDVIELLTNSFSDAASEGQYLATAIVYDVTIVIPNTKLKSDAIAVSLDHKSGYSVTVYKPYELSNGSIRYGAIFVNKARVAIFGNGT